MENKAVYFVVFFLASAFAAPQPQKNEVDIENSDVGYFLQNTRVVGGEPAADGAVPHQAAMSTGTTIRSYVCGASLVGPRHFLTAAHCIVAVRSCGIISGCTLTNSLRVHVGSNRWNRGDTRYRLAGNLTHPHYVHNIIKNDIGLLITTVDVVLSDRIRIIPLSFEHIGGGQAVTASGWGRLQSGGSLPNDLHSVDLITVGEQECVDLVREFAAINNINSPHVEPHLEICTFHSVGRGTCNGDSGSALVLAATGEQIGAVSWGFPCAVGAPDMFARVSGFKEFLEEGLNTLL